MERDEGSRRIEGLEQVTDAALSYLPLEQLLDQLLTRVREITGADTAAILMLEDDGRVLTARAAKGLEEEVERGVRIPVGRGFAGRIAAERRPVRVEAWTTPTSSTRSSARRGSSRCWARPCWWRGA